MAIPNTPSPLASVIAAKTYNANWFSGSTKEVQITAAIAAAVADGALYVYIPANLLPYNANLVVFNHTIRLISEGGSSDKVDLRAYGAAGDGIVDDATSINVSSTAAKTLGIDIFASSGTYKYTSQLFFTDVSVYGEHGTIFQPSSDVNSPTITLRTLIQTWSYYRSIEFHAEVNGTNCPNKVGVMVDGSAGGPQAVAARVDLSNSTIRNFGGSSGVGVQLQDVVGCNLRNTVLTKCYENLVINGTGSGTPTVCSILGGNIRECLSTTTGGAVVKNGYVLVFDGTVFESNASRGTYVIAKLGGTVVNPIFRNCWWENNWTSGGGTTKYHIEFDGTVAGINNPTLEDCYWSNHCKMVGMVGCANFLIRGGLWNTLADTIDIGANAHGRIQNAPKFVGTNMDIAVNIHGGGGFLSTTDYQSPGYGTFGDAAQTLIYGTNDEYASFIVPLTANRICTLSLTGVAAGINGRFIVLHKAADAFNVNVQRADATLLKALPQNTWGEFLFDGTVWQYVRSGPI